MLSWLTIGWHSSDTYAQKNKPVPPKPVALGSDGHLVYTPDALGNRIPDFSFCGYMAGEQAIPNVAIKVVVPVRKGDATRRIQAAINYIASFPIGTDGFRGAVLLEKGIYEIAGSLKISATGVVLRGSGMNTGGTTILGTGFSRDNLITIAGKNDRKIETPVSITDSYVPVNAQKIHVTKPSDFKVGDFVQIRRPSTKEWIQKLGTDTFGGGLSALGWKPGQRDLYWDRQVTAVNGSELTLDAPLTTALDSAYGGGTIAHYVWSGRIVQSGVENLQLASSYDKTNSKDEDHRWMAIVLENVQDAWVRQVVFRHFAGSAVNIQETAKRITVEDCQSLEPVSEIGGERRNTFLVRGQQVLCQRLYAESSIHDFAVGYCSAGPNAFVQCESHLPFSFSGSIDSWASGVLFDVVNIDGNAIRFANRTQDEQGAGWNAANSVLWQCTAARVDCYQPPTAQNWAFGTWAQFSGDGYWDNSNEHIQPRSLYYAQLKDRMGDNIASRTILLPVESEASSSPKVDVAAALTKQAINPAPTLYDFITTSSRRQPIPTTSTAKSIDVIGLPKETNLTKAESMQVQHGKLVRGSSLVVGHRQEVPWWNGSARPYGLSNAKLHITRFVPGMIGRGLTDNLDVMTDSMKADNIVAIDHNYGLWYERRRDDHERIRRMDGEVWPPFYELPFARSGKETAWDGLSKYDLTKYNHWYWDRLKQYADFADQKGLTLIHENYFQHNIIEAGAHYADFPWRPVNNINNTGFPEPVPYAGDKRIFMAEQFYDVSHPVRRALHRAYIRKCLDNFVGNSGVIQLIGAEFTGPLTFVQFWIDTISEWEKETGKKAIVGLSTTKDVQDAILADAKRASVVNLIDIRYWHYQANGTAYAPAGGQNLAPRQHARLVAPKKTSFEQVYRAVQEYRQKYPEKAVIYAADSYDAMGWAVLMAGGSMPNVPAVTDPQFLADATLMHPMELAQKQAGQWALGDDKTGYILYNESASPVELDLTKSAGSFSVSYINPKTGQTTKSKDVVKGGGMVRLTKQSEGGEVVWIKKSKGL
ncbi:pectate lyase [Spirosoma sp. BT704]|uniref:Pectate lyase n=1 Tax=Spirosoma validum TaxID=2771355 RepID=A0A927B9F1_9BACT|nr:pectate lyase [Spirosoma validum]